MTTLTEALASASEQLAGDDLISGPRDITFNAVRIAKDGRSTKVILSFDGDGGKPFKPCKTMGRAMVMVWGIVENREQDFVGKSVKVYRDPDVDFGPDKGVGGVRISHMSHIDKSVTVKLTVSQGKKKAFVFQPLAVKADAPAMTLNDARQAILNASDMDSLGMVWKSRAMAPFREELGAMLDEKKAELAGTDKMDTDNADNG